MISVLVPTRARPDRFEQMWNSFNATVKNPHTRILAYLQDDDIRSGEYQRHINVRYIKGPRLIMSNMWNELIQYSKGDIFMQAADDIIFRTIGWDQIVENAFNECPDKVLLCHGDDLSPHGKTFATLPFVHRRWVETVGYFTGQGYSADFSDTHPNDVADMIGRKKLLPIVIEHLHWIWGKSEKDQTYTENLERNIRDENSKLYASRIAERVADADKLKAIIGTPWP